MKISNYQLLLSVFLPIVFFTSCKTLKIDRPRESYLPSNIAPATSELPFNIEVDVKKIEAAVNRKLTAVLYEGSNVGGKDLSVKIIKVQNFTFSVKNNVIEYRVPLKIWTKFSWQVEKFGVPMGDSYEATGSIALTYKTLISIDKNWKLVAKTASSGYEWIDPPKINVLGVNVPVKPIADIALSKSEKLITEQIDKFLAEGVDIKKYANQGWNEIQKPLQVNSENNVWVRVTPEDVLMFPLTSSGNKLNVSFALNGKIESYVGSKPAENNKVALPYFKNVNRTSEQFNLNIGADITFDKITDVAKKELINKTFSEGKNKITVTDLAVFGSAGKPIFQVDVKGTIKGRFYFTGELFYNSEKMTVEIINPEFEVNTSNALVKTAGWLLHGTILKSMSPYLTYPIKDNLEKMKSDVNHMLEKFSVMDGITLQGKINTLKLNSLILVPGAIRIQANLQRNVGLKVQDLNL
jgi:Domain of unknown function (DUF4403)